MDGVTIPATAKVRHRLAVHGVVFCLVATLVAPAVGAPAAMTPFEQAPDAGPTGRIDELVFSRLEALGIEPARPCSDAIFVRRVFLDVIGTLPTARETADFIADRAVDKRARLIERLFSRGEFVDYWALRWADVLRVKAEFPIKLWPKGAEAYYRWIAACLAENRPYDRMARDLLQATGSNFYVPAVNFYRAMQARQPANIAQAVALTFMGTRADLWPVEQLTNAAVFFSQVAYKGTSEWKEEIVYLDAMKTLPAQATLPDGSVVPLAPGADARQAFVDWLVSPRNPWFARAIVNRIWYWLLGRGIVHEPDDIRPDNPAVNPALLAYLEKELVASGWDLRHIYRLVLNSRAYQLSAIPRSRDARAAPNFAAYPLRRLEAEVLIDAICLVTGTTERYVSAVPEPFTYVPEEMRTIRLSDGNSTSSFLELFGRPGRDSGLLSERDNTNDAGQRLHLLNSSHIHDKIAKSPALARLAQETRQPGDLVNALYLRILSRYPTDAERRALAAYRETGNLRTRDLLTDVAWALINSEEFLHRH